MVVTRWNILAVRQWGKPSGQGQPPPAGSIQIPIFLFLPYFTPGHLVVLASSDHCLGPAQPSMFVFSDPADEWYCNIRYCALGRGGFLIPFFYLFPTPPPFIYPLILRTLLWPQRSTSGVESPPITQCALVQDDILWKHAASALDVGWAS